MICLSCALWYFAGGSSYDITLVHGISHSEVFNSIWKIVDAANGCEKLEFSFPSDRAEQEAIAEGFKSVSEAGFGNCVGAMP